MMQLAIFLLIISSGIMFIFCTEKLGKLIDKKCNPECKHSIPGNIVVGFIGWTVITAIGGVIFLTLFSFYNLYLWIGTTLVPLTAEIKRYIKPEWKDWVIEHKYSLIQFGLPAVIIVGLTSSILFIYWLVHWSKLAKKIGNVLVVILIVLIVGSVILATIYGSLLMIISKIMENYGFPIINID